MNLRSHLYLQEPAMEVSQISAGKFAIIQTITKQPVFVRNPVNFVIAAGNRKKDANHSFELTWKLPHGR
jgi:hypothetical protein